MSKINLIPEVKQEQLKIKKINFFVTSAATVSAIVSVVILILLFSYIIVLKAQISSTNKETETLNDQLKAYADLEKTVISLETGLNQVKEVIKGGPKWSKFFDEVEKATPSDVQIIGFKIKGSEIELNMAGKEVSSIDRFIKSFSNHKYNDKNVFSNVVVDGFSRDAANKVLFDGKMKFEAGVIWN